MTLRARAVQALLVHLDAEEALVRGPVSEQQPGKAFGVVKWLDAQARAWWQGGRAGYLAFAFD